MAPKTRGSCRGAAVSKRKRSDHRAVREPSPSSDSSSSSATPTASPALATSEVDFLAGRVITTGRKVDFELFNAEGFLLGRQLLEMGWEKICSLDCPTYPALVKDFYKNLARGDNGLVSSVRNVRVNVSVDILSRLLSIQSSGPSTFAPEDRSPALSRLLNREIVEFEEVQANQLSLELRLLHNICSRVLFPKTGRFDYVSERDIFIMDAVISGKPINLPSMMLWYMADCGSKKKSCLPYGMVLTLIFRSQGVLISDSEPLRNLRHTDYYSLATVHRMGFVKKDGRWVRKNVTEDRADTEAPGPSMHHDSPVPSPSIPAPAPPPVPTLVAASSSTSFSDMQLDQLRSLLTSQKDELRADFESKFDNLKTECVRRFEELKEDFDSKFLSLKESLFSLDDRVGKIETTLGTAADNLKSDMKKIFEELGEIGGDSETYSKCNAELQEKIVVASAFLDRRLKEFVQVQNEGMSRIVNDVQRITRNFK